MEGEGEGKGEGEGEGEGRGLTRPFWGEGYKVIAAKLTL